MSRTATLPATVAVKLLCTALLLWALSPQNPYGFYVLLRWICCSAFAYIAVDYFHRGWTSWIWVFGTAAGIYNPFLPVHLGRAIWSTVNVVTIIILVVSVAADIRHGKKNDSEQLD